MTMRAQGQVLFLEQKRVECGEVVFQLYISEVVFQLYISEVVFQLYISEVVVHGCIHFCGCTSVICHTTLSNAI